MSLKNPSIDTIADRMLADYDAADPGTIFKEGLRLQLSDAWRVQHAVTKQRQSRGEKVIGYKIGCVSSINQEMMGLSHPVWGRLWEREVHDNGVVLPKSNYANLALEAEFGVRFNRSLKPGMSLEDIAASIDYVFPLLELHNLVMHGEKPYGHELIANNCINCGIVCGTPATDISASFNTDLKLILGNETVGEWTSLNWPDDILGAVPLLIDALDSHGLALNAGDLALTGAWGPPIALAQHTKAQVFSSGFNSVEATIV